jgi:hypothetical protein
MEHAAVISCAFTIDESGTQNWDIFCAHNFLICSQLVLKMKPKQRVSL